MIFIDIYLKKAILDYIIIVEGICKAIIKELYIESKDELLRKKHLFLTGEFNYNGYYKYTFHGRGCRVWGDTMKIDWDFGYGDNWCGINPWLLADYLSRIPNNSYEIFDGDRINHECEKEVLCKKMIKKFDLYYFA